MLLPPTLLLYVYLVTSMRRYNEPTQTPDRHVAIVFGAGLRADGTPTPMLADRVDAAVQLYHLGRVQHLLMSGDTQSLYHDEVNAMRRYAEERGVPPHAIVLDDAGLSTYETCYRARAIFGINDAVLVTQDFHLARALYICRQFGVDAIGVGTPDWGKYRDQVVLFYSVREAAATMRALWQVHITRPPPTFLGPYEGISGSRATQGMTPH